jgi:hypothetical protein
MNIYVDWSHEFLGYNHLFGDIDTCHRYLLQFVYASYVKANVYPTHIYLNVYSSYLNLNLHSSYLNLDVYSWCSLLANSWLHHYQCVPIYRHR